MMHAGTETPPPPLEQTLWKFNLSEFRFRAVIIIQTSLTVNFLLLKQSILTKRVLPEAMWLSC